MASVKNKTGSGQARVRFGERGPVMRCWAIDAAGARCQRLAMVLSHDHYEADALADCLRGHNFTPPKVGKTKQYKQGSKK